MKLAKCGRGITRVATANDLVVLIQARAVQDFGFALSPGGTARAGYKTPHLIPTFMQGLAGIFLLAHRDRVFTVVGLCLAVIISRRE